METQVAKFNKLMARAQRTNRSRDSGERDLGLATPNDGPLDLRLRTAISAIQAGIMIEDWNAVAEGLDMLNILHRDIRGGTCEPASIDN